MSAHVRVAPFNDLAAARAIIADQATHLAAVIVEPLQRCTPPLPGFLAGLRDGLARTLRDRGVTATVLGTGPLAQVVFAEGPIRDYRSAARGDRGRARAVMLELFRRGVFVNPMGTKLYLSVAHDRDAVDEFLIRFDAALALTG